MAMLVNGLDLMEVSCDHTADSHVTMLRVIPMEIMSLHKPVPSVRTQKFE